ncbi:MAG: transposase [Pyrinomonadaceae bacterium]
MDDANETKGWYSRGYLPHFDAGPIRTQFVTFRLFDSLPQNVLQRIRLELQLRKPENISRETFILAERYMDKGYGECFLRRHEIALIVKDTLLKFDEKRYRLHAWVIMPNHVHAMLRLLEGERLDRVMHSIKSFTASEANKVLRRNGTFWMREAFDRYIRDANHHGRVFRYIENNPVKARLCSAPEEWEFSSAWERLEKEPQHLAGNDREAS